jgi:hypothetical protein
MAARNGDSVTAERFRDLRDAYDAYADRALFPKLPTQPTGPFGQPFDINKAREQYRVLKAVERSVSPEGELAPHRLAESLLRNDPERDAGRDTVGAGAQDCARAIRATEIRGQRVTPRS